MYQPAKQKYQRRHIKGSYRKDLNYQEKVYPAVME